MGVITREESQVRQEKAGAEEKEKEKEKERVISANAEAAKFRRFKNLTGTAAVRLMPGSRNPRPLDRRLVANLDQLIPKRNIMDSPADQRVS